MKADNDDDDDDDDDDDHNDDNNSYSGSPLALTVLSGALQIKKVKLMMGLPTFISSSFHIRDNFNRFFDVSVPV